jgi:hypothetical protein
MSVTFSIIFIITLIKCLYYLVPLYRYLHLAMVEGLVSSSDPESKAGGSIATSRVSQAGEIKRVGTRRREMSRRWEIQ